jgi:hypothetical protein
MMRATCDVGPVSRILYGIAAADGHSSRPVIADRLKRPTRKFDASSRDVFWILLSGIPSLFGLAPCGVCHASSITARAVRSYRTFSPLPQPSNISGFAGLRPHCLRVRRKSRSAFAVHFSPRVPQRLAPASPSRPVRAERLSPSAHPAGGGIFSVALSVKWLSRHPATRSARRGPRELPSRTLSGTLLCGVRTFLSLDRAARETPASTSQTATIRFDISYPYYKMNLGSKGLTSTASSLETGPAAA